MARWAGVQKESRPIVMCHEMSHSRPTTMLVEPTSMAERYQGKAAAGFTRGTAAAGATDSMDRSLRRQGSPGYYARFFWLRAPIYTRSIRCRTTFGREGMMLCLFHSTSNCRSASGVPSQPGQRPTNEGGSFMLRRALILGVAVIALMSAGCAISDYEGYANHQTAG